MQNSSSQKQFTRWGSWPVPVLCTLLLVQIVFTLGARSSDNDLEWFDPIIDVRSMVISDFVEESDPQKMRDAAIGAMLESLDDPYTVWIPHSEEDDFKKQMNGSYVGIGAEISIEDNRLKISTPLEGSPALEAGIRAGDIVLEISGTDTLGLSTAECIEKLLGEAGTPVEMRVRHQDGSEELLTVIRRAIRTKTVKGIRRIGEDWHHMLDQDQGIGYIRLTQFTERTAPELREVLKDLLAEGARGIILDLRFNGGGTLDGAIDVADLFLEKGAIVSLRNRRGEGRAWTAIRDPEDVDVPLLVLINDQSASASEIVAGALQENDRAKILGERSFGKGSVQEVRQLSDDQGTLKMTTARYYLPSGRNITKIKDEEVWGVDPDPGFAFDLSSTQYGELYEARRAYELITDPADSPVGTWNDPNWIETEMKDPQLAAALRSISARANDGEWLQLGEESNQLLINSSELTEQIAFRNRLIDEIENAGSAISKLRNPDQDNSADEVEINSELITTGEVFELRDSNGNVIHRFTTDDPEALAAVINATSTPAALEQDSP